MTVTTYSIIYNTDYTHPYQLGMPVRTCLISITMTVFRVHHQLIVAK